MRRLELVLEPKGRLVNDLIAKIFALPAMRSDREAFFADVVEGSGARAVGELTGILGAVEFELRGNPDRTSTVVGSADWLHYPLIIEVYATTVDPDPLERQMVTSIESILAALSRMGARFVTASDLEGRLENGGTSDGIAL